VTSSAKKRREPGSTRIHQTPDGSFYDLMRNGWQVLQRCGMRYVPEVRFLWGGGYGGRGGWGWVGLMLGWRMGWGDGGWGMGWGVGWGWGCAHVTLRCWV